MNEYFDTGVSGRQSRRLYGPKRVCAGGGYEGDGLYKEVRRESK